MKSLDLPAAGQTAGLHRVLLFGSGIVGGSIAASLAGQAGRPLDDRDWPWDDRARRARTADALVADLEGSGTARASLVWAAGRSGMGSDDAQMAQETGLLAEVIALAGRIRALGLAVDLHQMSSAGGLFDGRRHVGADSVPEPARPYGQGKLRQERLLADAARTHDIAAHVYRPSTVYGFRPRARMGLIPVLVMNALSGRTSVIAGRHDTVRDYVAAEDVGRFVAARILAASPPPDGPILLASGRPAPIGEIVAETEQVLRRRLLLRYDPRPTNGGHMSYRKSAIPADFSAIDIRLGIRRVALAVQTHAFVGANG